MAQNNVHQLKEEGNRCFRSSEYSKALEKYSQALSMLEDAPSPQLAVTLHSNSAECLFRLKKYENALSEAMYALKIDNSHTKSLLRQAKCLEQLERYPEALESVRYLLKQEDQQNNLSVTQIARRIKSKLLEKQKEQTSPHFIFRKLQHSASLTGKDLCNSVHQMLKALEESKIAQVELCGEFTEFLLKKIGAETDMKSNISMTNALVYLAQHTTESAALQAMEAAIVNSGYLSRAMDGISAEVYEDLYVKEEYRERVCSMLSALSAHGSFSALREKLFRVIYSIFCRLDDKISSVSTLKAVESQLTSVVYIISTCGFALEKENAESAGNDPNTATAEPKICNAIRHVRKVFLSKVLHSNCLRFVGEGQLKDFIISILSITSGKTSLMMKDMQNVKVDIYEEKKAEPVDEEFLKMCTGEIVPNIVSRDFNNCLQALRALSFLAQSCPATCHSVILMEKTFLPRIFDIALGYTQEFEMDIDEDSEIDVLSTAAAEVVALCSSNTVVRNAIAEAAVGTKLGSLDLFFGLMKNDSLLIRAHACLTLSKLAPVNKDIAKKVLEKDRVIRCILGILASGKDKYDYAKAAFISVEVVTYLSVFEQVKTFLVKHNEGKGLKRILNLAVEESQEITGRTLRYAIAQILGNLSTSVEDLQARYNSEVEQLKKAASKGLKANQEVDIMESSAGSAELIQELRGLLVEYGAVLALSKAFKNPFSKKTGEGWAHNLKIQETVAQCMLNLATVQKSRGRLVQEGGLALLIDLSLSKSEDCKKASAMAIAKIGVSVNPNLLASKVQLSMIRPLLYLLKEADHELAEYEALLALTNLSSVGVEIRSRLFQEDAWYAYRNLLTSENEHVQRAAIEAQSNMVMCPEMLERFSSVKGSEDLRLMLIFCKADDEGIALAATGAIAMLSEYEEIAPRIVSQEGVRHLNEAFSYHVENEEIRYRINIALRGLEEVKAVE